MLICLNTYISVAALVGYVVCCTAKAIAYCVKRCFGVVIAAHTRRAGASTVLQSLVSSVVGAVKLVALAVGRNFVAVITGPACLA